MDLMMRRAFYTIGYLALAMSMATSLVSAQSPTNSVTPDSTADPKPKALDNFQLPNQAGQHWVEYDIRPFTKVVKGVDKPQQILVDWILRETGTDVWFHEPMGILTADKSTLRIYHNASMQAKVAQIYERFVNGVSEPQVFGLRMLTIGNSNWRAKSFGLMTSFPVKSPGVQAWLMTKENAAIFLSQLRERSDARELQAVEIPLYNGQLQVLEQMRSRNYLKEFGRNTATPFPPFAPVSDEIKEGFRLQISPLLSLDNKTADIMVKCDIDQVERLTPVRIEVPVSNVQTQPAQIEVPQFVSWRLSERMLWPTDHVLLMSCGVVTAPGTPMDNSLTGNPPSILGLNRILPASSQRADALLWLEYKGSYSTQLTSPVQTASLPTAPTTANAFGASSSSTGGPGSNNNLSRGRY
jgi:hypothetical protein